MLTKDKLIFNEADVASSDQVGAHILGTADAKVSSTNVGGKEGLDVNIVGVSLDSEYAEDSAHSDEDVGQFVLAVRQDTLAASADTDGDYGAFKLNSLGELYVHDTDTKAQLVLANTSLDAIEASAASIDGKDFATETTLAAIKGKTDQFTFNSGRLEVFADIDLESDVADDAADSENPLKVGSRAINGALTAISASGDKANVISDMYRRVYVNDAPNVGFKVSAATVGTSAVQLVSSPLLGRVRIMIQNLGNKEIYIGFDNTVTSSNGLKVNAGAFLEMPFGEDLAIWAISTAAGQDIRIVEVA